MKEIFNFKLPVEKFNDFWGRDSDLRKVFSRINADRPQSIAIVGGRKIGKSSFINIMNMNHVYENYLKTKSAYIFLNLKIEKTIINIESFFEKIKKLIRENDSLLKYDSEEEDGYSYFKSLVQSCMDDEKKIVVFLDDFHFITQNGNFPLEFFSFLRSVANSYNVAYVTTSYLVLQKLCVTKDIEESPFFNIFSNFSLKQLEKSEIYERVNNILVTHGVSIAGKNYFWDNTCNHPYLMSVVGSLLINNELEKIEELALQELHDFFEQLWNDMEDREKDIVKRIAQNRSLPNHMVHIARELGKNSVLTEEVEKWQLFTPLFRTYLINNHIKKSSLLRRIFSNG